MTLKLYDLTDQYRRLLDEDDDAYAVALEQLGGELTEKACNVAAIRAELLAEAEAIKSEVDRLTARMRARTNRADSLKQYLYENMRTAEIDSIKDARFSLRIQDSPMSIEVTDVAQVPDEFCRIERIADKRALADAVKGGRTFFGISVLTGNKHLVISMSKRKPSVDVFACVDCGRTLPIGLAWIDPDGKPHGDDIVSCWALEPVNKETVNANHS